MQIDRIEFSFYGDKLKNMDFYRSVIKDFFPRSRNKLSTYKVFYDVSVDHYWKTLYKG